MSSLNIYIVDDSPLTQQQLTDIFKEAGHHIVGTASNGVAAVQFFQENRSSIDLVTLDITLPGKSGIEVLKELIEMKPSLNVIMVSAMGKDSVIKECLAIGAKNFVTKPFQKDKLLAMVSYIFK